MYSINELEGILGYTSDQIRLRLEKLKPILTETVRRGKNNKILVTDNGLEILRRAKQLEERGIPLNEIPEKLENEMDQSEEQTSAKSTETDRNLVEEKNKRIEDLQDRIEELKEDKRYWRNQTEELQQKLIAGETVNKEDEDPYKDKSLWQVIREWLNSPVGWAREAWLEILFAKR